MLFLRPSQAQLHPVTTPTTSVEHLLMHQLEPSSLVRAFLNNPPLGFVPLEIPARTNYGARAECGLDRNNNLVGAQASMPCFLADFDLTTTLDEQPEWLKKLPERFPYFRKLTTFFTLFGGTTVSEYSLTPHVPSYDTLLAELLKEMRARKAAFTIIKDIPCQSPVLDEENNQSAAILLDECKRAGFTIVAGQALAYVKIDFASIDEYLGRMSSSRRKDLRRKLRTQTSLSIRQVRTGDAIFFDERFLHHLYSMYLNVYDQSEIHFDKLSFSFFEEVLQNRKGEGIIFLYERQGKLIGWNLCFIHNNSLIDKFVGFTYPDAREANLYFVSWFANLQYALDKRLDFYIAGWTDPQVKASLGASFTFTKHAVYVRNPILKMILKPFQRFFEADLNWSEQNKEPKE